MTKQYKVHHTIILFVVASVVALALAEGVLRLAAPHGYYVWPPHQRIVFDPAPGALPGVKGVSTIVINESGLRGRSFSDADRFRVLAVGGSTTECLYLDDTEAWPYLLEQNLNQGSFGSKPVWVGNVGKSGHNSSHHVLQVEKLLDQYPHIDVVLTLVGVNDLIFVLKNSGYVPMTPEELDEAFALRPGWTLEDSRYPFYKRTELWRTLRKVKSALFTDSSQDLVEDRAGTVFVWLREQRRLATGFRDELPDLTVALNVYKSNLNAIVSAAEKRGTRVVFMTQPSLWTSHPAPEVEKLLWMGRVGAYASKDAKPYLTTAAIERAINAYNDTLLQVCKDRALSCLDLASEVPKTPEMFYDDVHFTEQGSRSVARTVATFFEQTQQGR
jgi:lysophospholipase L1-like esterase